MPVAITVEMTRDTMPLLYSFRRCPYAIRARMAIWSAGIHVQLEEVSLKNKPQSMLQLSSKGTVPVLVHGDQVLDESLDIMLWALRQNDPGSWVTDLTEEEFSETLALITDNDGEFKRWLDRYKYADRHPEFNQEYYRTQCGNFLGRLEERLQLHSYLLTDQITLADIAIFPFVRQFSMVDKHWWDQHPYPSVAAWLASLLESPLFIEVMAKRKPTGSE